MAIKLKEIIKKELIGSNALVVDSKNKSNIGIEGKIIDETKNTIVIRENKSNKKKKLFKENIKIEIEKENEKIIIEGKGLVGRPKERIKW